MVGKHIVVMVFFLALPVQMLSLELGTVVAFLGGIRTLWQCKPMVQEALGWLNRDQDDKRNQEENKLLMYWNPKAVENLCGGVYTLEPWTLFKFSRVPVIARIA